MTLLVKRRGPRGSYVIKYKRTVSRCRRCHDDFQYERVTKPRFYCDGCLVLEHADSTKEAKIKRYLRSPEGAHVR